MSNVNSIRDDLITALEKSLPSQKVSTINFRKEIYRKIKRQTKYHQDIVTALIELETYDICSTPTKRDIDPDLKALIYAQLNNLERDKSKQFINDILGALPKMMADIETSREVDVYARAAGIYLYVLPKAIMKCSDFGHHLDEAARISRYRERALPPSNQYCSNGWIFLNCQLQKPSEEVYALLFKHFKRLLWNALHINPENIPEILSHADSLLFGTGYSDDLSYEIPQQIKGLWGYSKNREIAQEITKCSIGKKSRADLKELLEKQYKPELIAYLVENTPSTDTNEADKEITEAIEDILLALSSKEVSEAIEIETLQTLGQLLEKNPEIIIKCREHKNPAGATSINIGRPLVPSSINACIAALIYHKFYRESPSIHELLEYQIVDAVGILTIYELWKDFIFSETTNSTEDYLKQIEIPRCAIGELQSAKNRIETLAKSFEKILLNKKIIERLSLSEENSEKLRAICKDLCIILKDKLETQIESQIKNQPLDPNAFERFKSEMLEDWQKTFSTLPLLKKIRLSKCNPYTITRSFPRYAFLADTGTHFVFHGLGIDSLRNYHNYLARQILEHASLTPNSSLPTPFGTVIIATYKAVKELKQFGFEMRSGELIWPNKSNTMRVYVTGNEPSLYYQILEDEHLINLSYKSSTESYPVTIEYIDKKESVEISLRYNFSLSDKAPN